MENKKLCINPTCSSHCDVVLDAPKDTCKTEKEWRFSNGFGMPLDKTQLKYFVPEDDYNLCAKCEGLIGLLVQLKLLPEIPVDKPPESGIMAQ